MSLLSTLARPVAQTAPSAPDARLRTRHYPLSMETVWSSVQRLAREQPGWTVRKSDPEQGLLEVEARGRVLRVVDPVTIRVKMGSGRRVSVDLTSRSRVGPLAFGAHARRIAQFLEALDAELSVPRTLH